MFIKNILDKGVEEKLYSEYACSFETSTQKYHFFSKNQLQQFDLASLTKIYATKILYLLLLKKNLLSLEEIISDYDERLPSYTFKQLFNHETLFLPWAPIFLEKDPVESCLKYHFAMKAQYSDLNYILLWELSKRFTSPLETLHNFYTEHSLNLSFVLDSKNFVSSTSKNDEEKILCQNLHLEISLPERPLMSVYDYNAYKGLLGHAGLLGSSLEISYLNKFFYKDFKEQPFGFKTEKNFNEPFYLLGHDAFTGCYSFVHEDFSFVLLTNRLIYGKQDLTHFRRKLLYELIKNYIPSIIKKLNLKI